MDPANLAKALAGRVTITVSQFASPEGQQAPIDAGVAPVVPASINGFARPGDAPRFVIQCDHVPQPIHVFQCACPALCSKDLPREHFVVDVREIVKVYNGALADDALQWARGEPGVAEVKKALKASGEPAAIHCIDARSGNTTFPCAVPVSVAMRLLSMAPTPWGKLWERGILSSPDFTAWFSKHCCGLEEAGGAGTSAAGAGAGPGVPAALRPIAQEFGGETPLRSPAHPPPSYTSNGTPVLVVLRLSSRH